MPAGSGTGDFLDGKPGTGGGLCGVEDGCAHEERIAELAGLAQLAGLGASLKEHVPW